jgi:outer membrane beta-barrel protein
MERRRFLPHGEHMITPKTSWGLLLGLISGVLIVLMAQPALAQEEETTRQDFEDTVHVIQRKPVLQKGRFDLAPRMGVSVNDSMYRHYKAAVNGNYHFSERAYVGGLFEWYNFGDLIGGETGAFEETRNETRAAADAAVVNWVGGLEVGYKPIVGKFALFDSFILYYDVAVTAGGAFVNAESLALPSASGTFGGTVSAVSRLFLNDWMALNLEVRDLIFTADLRGEPGALTNIVTIGGGVSLYLPTTFEYSSETEAR